MKTNAQTVQNIYAAFGRGDVPAILEVLAEDIEWEYAGSTSDVPWLQAGRGRAAAVRFFEALAAHVEFKRFTVNDVLDGGNVVVGLCDVEAVVKATGRTFHEVDEGHVWRFDERGRVVKFRHAANTHGHVAAWKGL